VSTRAAYRGDESLHLGFKHSEFIAKFVTRRQKVARSAAGFGNVLADRCDVLYDDLRARGSARDAGGDLAGRNTLLLDRAGDFGRNLTRSTSDLSDRLDFNDGPRRRDARSSAWRPVRREVNEWPAVPMRRGNGDLHRRQGMAYRPEALANKACLGSADKTVSADPVVQSMSKDRSIASL
jgi:hypothetical protein